MSNPDINTLNDALIEVVKLLGGSKSVGVKLWPAKGVEAAQRHLLACLKSERAEKLAIEEVVHIMRMGRDAGHHGAMTWLCEELGYTNPTPISRDDEVVRVSLQLAEATKALSHIAKRMESLMEGVK